MERKHTEVLTAKSTNKREILGDPEDTANMYCKSLTLLNTYTQNYGTDLP